METSDDLRVPSASCAATKNAETVEELQLKGLQVQHSRVQVRVCMLWVYVHMCARVFTGEYVFVLQTLSSCGSNDNRKDTTLSTVEG